MTLKALNWLLDDTLTGEENSYFNFGLIGVQDKISKISSINECLDMADLKNRIRERCFTRLLTFFEKFKMYNQFFVSQKIVGGFRK